MTDQNKKKEMKTSSQSSMRSLGMGPSLRMASTDIRELIRAAENITTSRLTPEGGSPPGETIFDCIAYVIYCPQHQKMAVSKVERAKAVWLPFIACSPNKTWAEAAEDGVSIILQKQHKELDAKLATRIPIKETMTLHLFRFQTPQKQKFISRLIQFVKLDKSTKDFKCCQNTKRIEWMSINEIISGNIDKVWGPEVCRFGQLAKDFKPQGIDEYGLEEVLFYVSKDSPRSVEESMLKELNIGEAEIEKLYSDFIEHCFPAFSMTLYSFINYMTKYSYQKNDSRFPSLFNAFNYEKNGFLSFHELLLGLASMEPTTSNREARIKFVFRYYDSDGDEFLCEDEFKKLIEDIAPECDENKLKTKYEEAIQAIGVKNNKISLQDFCKAVSSKTFRGTSNLCRSSKAILSQISQSITDRTEERSTAQKTSAGFLKANRRNKGICYGCKGKKYDYSLHSIKLDYNGRCVEPRRIFEPESVDEQMNSQRYSMEYSFNTRSIPHVFLDMIREFNQKRGTLKDPKGFMSGSADRQTFIKYLECLCSLLENILLCEQRVIRINSPAYLVGDINGNLEDLLAMERLLWQSFPIISANYVFLGNFVDFGKWGLESCIYLFALKIIAPNKFMLLRGNHEVRQIQIKCTFQKECLQKYGHKLGQKVWELINGVFDKLPLSVIIDESIFCSHSGIPKSGLKLSDIQSIASDLKNPEKDSAIAWELLNNEPGNEDEFANSQSVADNSGFGPNKKTGIGYLFNESAVKTFLSNNGFSHIIRGHSVTSEGYGFHFMGKCLTVFSCSQFSGQNNRSAAIFVDCDKIRIIRLDTKQNQK